MRKLASVVVCVYCYTSSELFLFKNPLALILDWTQVLLDIKYFLFHQEVFRLTDT